MDPIVSIRKTLTIEAEGLARVMSLLDEDLSGQLDQAIAIIAGAGGRVVVSGMGKSGHIGTKLAATLASTGTPAFFVHPAEASHGDLGMITEQDVVVALSWSGETPELLNILEHTARFDINLIALTSAPESTLATAADVAIVLPKVEEACPHGLAPTSSSLIQMAVGDAIAVALLEKRGFSATDFRTFHPGGKLGANLRHVSEVMHGGDKVPLAPTGYPMRDALVLMTQKGFGALGIVDEAGRLIGVITDGDLRRNLDNNLLEMQVEQVMTSNPKTIVPSALAASALEQLEREKITAIFVIEDDHPIGVLHLHDLLRIGAA